MPTPDIRLIVFDLGGVMIRLVSGWPHALQRAGVAQHAGLDFAPHKPVLDQVIHDLETSKIDHQEFARRVAQVVGTTPQTVQAAFDAWLIEPYPGFDPLLDRLLKTPLQTACLSNTSHAHWSALSSPGPCLIPVHRLHHQFTSFRIGQCKPHPEVYQHVQRQTALEPGHILFFDDSQPNVQAALDQGWHAHRIDPQADPATQITGHLRDYSIF